MAKNKSPLIIIIGLAIATLSIVTPMIYRKITNYYISKKVKERFSIQGKELPVIISLNEMIIPLDTNNSRLMDLQVGLQIAAGQIELETELQTKSPLIKSTFSTLVQQYNVSQLRQVSNKNLIKERAIIEINDLLETGSISDVFFEKYLILSPGDIQKE